MLTMARGPLKQTLSTNLFREITVRTWPDTCANRTITTTFELPHTHNHTHAKLKYVSATACVTTSTQAHLYLYQHLAFFQPSGTVTCCFRWPLGRSSLPSSKQCQRYHLQKVPSCAVYVCACACAFGVWCVCYLRVRVQFVCRHWCLVCMLCVRCLRVRFVWTWPTQSQAT